MLLTKEQLQQVIDKVNETVTKLNSIYKFSMANPNIHYDVRGTKAGVAKSHTMSVHFNPTLAIENWDNFINDTVPHEVCHVAVWQWAEYFKKPYPKPHGSRWKIMMFDVGVNPRRTHDYDVSNVKQKNVKKYQYKCGCATPIEVSSIIHNRIQKGSLYRCLKCRTSLSQGSLKLTKVFSRPSR